ncbi:MAG: FtsX-like permease family protein, partial [Bacteroidota bacterium]
CILIMIYVHNELTYDTFNSKYDRTYRVLHHFRGEKDYSELDQIPVSEYQVWGCAPIAQSLKDFYPQVEDVFRFTSDFDWLVEYKGKRFQEKGIAFADSTAHKVFDWNWIAGDPETALTRPNTIILSKEMAKKYFGDEDPIGKTLIMDGEDPFEVTAVYEIPSNSHFSFPGFISMTTFIKRRSEVFDWWGYADFYTYFTINENADIAQLEQRIPDLLTTYTKEQASWYSFRLEPMADAYLDSEAGRQPGPVGNENNIYVFISVAIFILIIACINFMNLSTARSVERAKEVAIRKAIGSQRRTLIFQFLIEAMILTFSAALLAAGLVSISHSYLEILVGKTLPATWLFAPQNVLIGIFLFASLGLLTGSYPAFVISSFQPIKVLKGSFKNSSEGVWLRKALVVLQFSLSIILIVGTAVVYNQLNYLRDYDKGFDSEQVLVVDYGWDPQVQQSLDYVKSEFLKHTAVQAIAASRATPGDFFPNAGTSIEAPDGEMTGHSPALYEIDEDFIPTYGMQMVAGRNYAKEFPTDSSSSMILNEAAARLYGYDNPADIIGKKFDQWGREGQVVGVVNDFNYLSLHREVEPLALRYSTKSTTSMLSLKLSSTNYYQTLEELEELWNELVPHYPFVAHFNDANFNKQYEEDERFGTTFSIFSGLAMLVACFGLFGLTIYSTAQRTKEIGVRKVLGASIRQLVTLLSTDFLKLYLISLLIAIPVSWYTMNSWLDGFAYQIQLDWKVFFLAASATLIVSFITMSFKTVSAALANPTESLRDE